MVVCERRDGCGEEKTKMKKMSPKTFREWAELSLKNHRQRMEREEAEDSNQIPNQKVNKDE